MCIVLSINEYVWIFEGHLIKHVCWREFVCELPRIPQALYAFCRISCEWDEWHSLRSSGSSSIPSLHSLLTWLPCISDLSGSSLILVFSASSSSSSFSLPIHCFHSTFKLFLTVTHFSGLIFFSHHHYTSHYQFDLFHLSPHRHYVHFRHHWVPGSWDLLYLLHFIQEGMSFDHWVFRPGFPSFQSPYHLSLRYILCLKTTLRPWDQISSSATSAWTGVWDSVAIWISSCFFFWEIPFWWLDSFQLCWDYRDHAFDGGWFDDTWPFLIYHTSDAI